MSSPKSKIVFIVAALVAACFTQAQIMIRAHPGLNVQILRQKNVREELKLDEKAGKAVDDILAKIGEHYQIRIEGGGDPDEIQKQVQDQFAAADKEARKALQGVLTADQSRRFEELSLQSLGIGALLAGHIQTVLAMSEEQKKAAEAENAKADEYMASLATTTNDGGGQEVRIQPDKAQQKKLREIRDKGLTAVTATFSEDQKKKWAELVGKKFDFAEG